MNELIKRHLESQGWTGTRETNRRLGRHPQYISRRYREGRKLAPRVRVGRGYLWLLIERAK